MQQGVTETTDALWQARQKYQQGLYRQTFDILRREHGEPAQWRDPELQLLGGRTLNHLGRSRTALALMQRAWRGAPERPRQRYYRGFQLLGRRGPWAALRFIQQHGEILCEDDPHLQGLWLGHFATLYSIYRDWERSHEFLERALALHPDSSWLALEHAVILQREDRYPEAMAVLEPWLASSAPPRPVVAAGAELLLLLDQRDDAVALLAKHAPRMESVELCLRLYDLLLENGERDAAAEALQRARSLVPELPGTVDRELVYREFELHYERGELDQALQAADELKDPFVVSVRERLRERRDQPAEALLPVAFVRQHHMTCAPATFVALARYWGHQFDHLEVAEQICYDGTPASTERRWISELGWHVREFEMDHDIIRALVDRGVPVALSTVEPGSAHMQAIVGYDLRKGVYKIRDPFSPLISEMLMDGAAKRYAATGPRCMVVVPSDQAGRLEGIELPAARLYDHYHDLQLALERHDRPAAVTALEQLRQEGAEHRLVLWGERSLAAYDHDAPASLKTLDALLERYPEDLNLIASRADMLGELGRFQEQRTYLREQLEAGHSHPLLIQTLVHALRHDYRVAEETHQWLERLLRLEPTRATALYSLAGLNWDEGKREQAFELYRLCACLEDKVERYAQSYFKAARFLRQTDQALDWLRRRADRLGPLSADARVTLALMLEQLDLSREAAEVFEQALNEHPRNVWLVNEALIFYQSRSDLERARALLAQRRADLPEAMVLEFEGDIARQAGDLEQASVHFRALLALRPFHTGALRFVAGQLRRDDSLEAALAFIDRQGSLNPHDYGIRGVKLDFLEALPPSQRWPQLEALAAQAGDDSRVAQAMADCALERGDYAQALRFASRVLAEAPEDHRALVISARAHLLAQDNDAAAQAFRAAIRASVDRPDAFHGLLECYPDVAAKREALGFIHRQLLEQVTFGDGVQAFVALARRFLTDEEVAAFVDQVIAERPDLWQSWLAAAHFHRDVRHLDRALECIQEGCRRFPLIPRLWLESGRLRLLADDTEGAEADLTECLRQSPDWVQAVISLSDVLEVRGDFDASEGHIDRALRRLPREGLLLGYKSDLLWRRGQREEAFDTMVRALAETPDYHWGWDKLGEWARETDRRGKALALAERLANEQESNADLWRHCYMLTDEQDQELAFIERARALRPHDPSLVIDQCEVLHRIGREKEIEPLLSRDYWRGPPPTEVLGFTAWLRHQQGDRDTAISMMRDQVLRDDPAFSRGWRLLATWYKDAGEVEPCLHASRQLVALQPGHAGALVEAAELMLEVTEGDARRAIEEEVSDYLERALARDYSDTYIQLTLLDHYMDSGHPERARELMTRILVDEGNVFVRARQLRLALESAELDAAWPLYQSVVRDWRDNNWLLLEPLAWVAAAGADARQALWRSVPDWLADPDMPDAVVVVWARAQALAGVSGDELLANLERLRRDPRRGGLFGFALEWLLDSDEIDPAIRLRLVRRHWWRLRGQERVANAARRFLAGQKHWLWWLWLRVVL